MWEIIEPVTKYLFMLFALQSILPNRFNRAAETAGTFLYGVTVMVINYEAAFPHAVLLLYISDAAAFYSAFVGGCLYEGQPEAGFAIYLFLYQFYSLYSCVLGEHHEL